MDLERLKAALAGRYRIERELGRGGMATVYLAHDLKHDRDVAIKVMHGELSAAIGADRFLREIATIAKLQHPHILPLIDSSSDASLLYYVAPYVRGETLRDLLIREKHLPPDHAGRLAAEIADALAYAHREGVVHRDIKPENILIQEGHAVVADFGVARALAAAGATNMTQAGLALGTPAYMSPEQAMGLADIDGRSDVYAIGCLLFEMLTGRPPFAGDSAQQVVAAHVTTPAPGVATVRSDTPRALSALVDACLAKDPKARPDAATLAEGLRTGGTHATAPLSRRAMMLTAAAVVLAVVGTWWYFGRGGSATTSIGDDAAQIAVMPLSAISDTSLTRLGQDLVVTLSTTLDGVGELRTVDAATLLLNTRNAPSPLPLAQAREIAGRLGAGSVLTGTLIGEGGQVRASVALYRIDSDTALIKASALAPAGDIVSLTDSLTWQVLRQVWRRGTPPSPLLAGLTTGSFEALRHFLDGERSFQRLDVETAIGQYRQAFELDSNFVQAYLRYQAAKTWNLQATEDEVTARLVALADRLPERDRLWLETTTQPMSFPERTERWRKLIQQYPDYPPILMSGVDGIIHSGPFLGIALDETLPVLERLSRLTPDNADVWYHKAMVETALGMTAEAATSSARGAAVAEEFHQVLLTNLATDQRTVLAPDSAAYQRDAMALIHALTELPSDNPNVWFSGMLSAFGGRIPERLALVERAQREVYSGDLLVRSHLGEGLLQIARGDWSAGLTALQQNESGNGSWAERANTARLAVLGAWLGAVDPAVAAGAVARSGSMPGAGEAALDRMEQQWFEGMLAVLREDDRALDRIVAALRGDEHPAARQVAASLRAQWLVRKGVAGAADSVRAVSDAVIGGGAGLFTAEVVNRFVIARALRSRGQPEAVERYLLWNDALYNSPRTFTLRLALAPLVQFERGMALEEAGNHSAAVLQLSRFVEDRDRPSAGEREMLAEAQRVIGGVPDTDRGVQSGIKP